MTRYLWALVVGVVAMSGCHKVGPSFKFNVPDDRFVPGQTYTVYYDGANWTVKEPEPCQQINQTSNGSNSSNIVGHGNVVVHGEAKKP